MSTIASSKDAMAQARLRMEKAVEDFRKELAGMRTGRANVTLLDHVRVDYHGTSMPVNQLGSLSVPEPTMIVISPWDPGAVPLIDKAIRTSDLGLNPTNDGKIVRVPIPSLTEERRKDMVKHLHKVLENHRTAQHPPRHQGSDRKTRERKKDERGRTQAVRGRTRKIDALGNQKDRGPLRAQGKRTSRSKVTTLLSTKNVSVKYGM